MGREVLMGRMRQRSMARVGDRSGAAPAREKGPRRRKKEKVMMIRAP